MLQPANVELRGYSNEEMDALRDAVFMRGLRERMGLPTEEGDNGPADPNANGQQPQQRPVNQAPPVPHQPQPAPPPPRQRPVLPPTPRSRPAPDPSASLFFRGGAQPGPSVQLPPLPAQTRHAAQLGTDDSIEFDDDLDDSFLREVEMVERRATSQPSGLIHRAGQGGGDVIAISDSEEEDKENIPVPLRKRSRREEPEVIELSD
ncbi:hypothetical protein CALCODRAFT_511532 [Calocera cornea HHB12733]|uniref:Uncharacterized protein n=1 Tax=Calocera cornea HHB12733 TaxID=1353952 RepID=A0A165DPC6_9BASI|nr:hypothetical protein CALCODRAFT_511532 [Calocera cornea HHB12733]